MVDSATSTLRLSSYTSPNWVVTFTRITRVPIGSPVGRFARQMWYERAGFDGRTYGTGRSE